MVQTEAVVTLPRTTVRGLQGWWEEGEEWEEGEGEEGRRRRWGRRKHDKKSSKDTTTANVSEWWCVALECLSYGASSLT